MSELTAEALDGLAEVTSVDASAGHVLLITRSLRIDVDDYDCQLLCMTLDGAVKWLHHAPGQQLAQVRVSPKCDWFAYVATGRDGGLWVRSVDNGVARRLFDGPVSSAPLWTPDGKQLVIATRIAATDRQVLSRLPIASDTHGGEYPRPLRLVAVEMDGAARPFSDSADELQPCSFSADGAMVACVRLRFGRDGRPQSVLRLVRLSSGEWSEPSLGLTWLTAPSFAPSGRGLAFLGAAGDFPPSDHACLELFACADACEPSATSIGGLTAEHPVVQRAPALDRGPRWLDRRTLAVRTASRGRIGVTAVSLETRQSRPLVSGQVQVLDFVPTRPDELICAAADATEAALVLRVTKGSAPRRIWSSGWAAGEAISRIGLEPRCFDTPTGDIDGWLLGDRSLPAKGLAVSLHGGPHGFVGPTIAPGHFYRWILASRGWVVVAFNQSGSGSYGPAFAASIRGQWGRRDLAEVLAISQALQTELKIPPGSSGLVGYSYGGYLATWAAIKCRLFAAAVAGAPITNFESFAGTSDIGPWFMAWELALESAEDLTRAQEFAPVRHASELQTPLLLLHGTNDRRCPLGQSQEFFHSALTRSNTPVELVVYDGASHNFPSGGRPSHRVDYNRRIVTWLEHNLRPSLRI
ncbi:MAG: S9 family peptidase [Myxococcales bacterium]|nr:S9 family peptidase [Myxococcales bacterium]